MKNNVQKQQNIGLLMFYESIIKFKIQIPKLQDLHMSIFNQTFTQDKPIYYPSNWQTGKTAVQLYQQWKLTTQYFLLSNVLQCLIAGLWLCFVFVVCNAIKQMWRLYRLEDNKRQKIENRYFIQRSFVISTIFVSLMAFSVTLTLCFLNQFTRNSLIKGLVFCLSIYSLRRLYVIGRIKLNQYRQRQNEYERIKKEQESN